MKVLVTGGTGFIGSHLIKRLVKKGHEVICIAKDEMNMELLKKDQVKVVLCDLNEDRDWKSILNNIDIIYHLAGVTRAKKFDEYYDGNYRATKNFVSLCIKHANQLSRFIYVSSLAAVGPTIDDQPIGEDSPYSPVSDYGKSKMLAEQEVLKARSKLPITIIRPSAVYGPRERDMYDYIKMIKQGYQLLIGFHKKWLNLIHVNDLVDGILLAGENDRAKGEIYFIGSKSSYTQQELGYAIAKAVSTKPIRIHLPHVVVYLIGLIVGFIGKCINRQMFFNLEKAREAVQERWDCNIKKATDQLSFNPRISLADGMKQTYKWYLDNSWL